MRPFVVQLARRYRQCGWVGNTAEGLSIAIEGAPDQQEAFLRSLNDQLPPLARIVSMAVMKQTPANYSDFRIKASAVGGKNTAFVLPDIAVCRECIGDIFDSAGRFYRYPFTSCSYCGPRYSIMRQQPYDRGRTSMVHFNLCPACKQDYLAIDNRRYHAQTLACPRCGPSLSLLDQEGRLQAEKEQALTTAIRRLREGKIIAVKGIGGFQLMVDAANQGAVQRLRTRKKRPQKPFALMVADLSAAERLCFIDALERETLTSHAAPIALLKRRGAAPVADAVAPGSGLFGIMLAYSPLHHLLLHDFGAPVVATSGNRQNEPICIDNGEALTRLSGIADYFLVHDRPILRPLDDSIVRQLGEKMTVLRRARGYAPLPIDLDTPLPDMLAFGGQSKSTVAVSRGRQIIMSPHLGDLDSEASYRHFEATLSDLEKFYQIKPVTLMRDLHDGYLSSQAAERLCANSAKRLTTEPVQHHYAHVLSCMAEHGLEPPVLGIAWDGTGLGVDNTLWGGEFLLIHDKGFQRFAHFRPFLLPGGYQAIREPRRTSLGMRYEIFSDHAFDVSDPAFTERELKFLSAALSKRINCPTTTSAGRMFDAAASLLGLCHVNAFEGQAAMALEDCAGGVMSDDCYPFQINETEPRIIDWRMMWEQMIDDIKRISREAIAEKFHNTLSEMILAAAMQSGERTIVLSGGCFQNDRLVTKTFGKLKAAGL
ncbi:MAG: carbamoyltransferase HypF, partial [Gammaproteobacteria bacterium]